MIVLTLNSRPELRQRFSLRDELQRHAVVAPPLSSGWRPIVEHVTLVPAAADAVVLGSWQDEPVIALGAETSLDRLVEARPARSAVELGLRAEKREIAGGAHVGALPLFLVERARERRFRSLLEQDGVGLRRKELAPFGLGFLELGDRLARPAARP